MFGKGAYNNFRSQFFKKSSQPGFKFGGQSKSFFTQNKMKMNSQFSHVEKAMKIYQMQLVRMSSTMTLQLCIQNAFLLNPDSSSVIEEDQDAEEDDSTLPCPNWNKGHTTADTTPQFFYERRMLITPLLQSHNEKQDQVRCMVN
eukprot:403330753